jgi:hypothetical protein
LLLLLLLLLLLHPAARAEEAQPHPGHSACRTAGTAGSFRVNHGWD